MTRRSEPSRFSSRTSELAHSGGMRSPEKVLPLTLQVNIDPTGVPGAAHAGQTLASTHKDVSAAHLRMRAPRTLRTNESRCIFGPIFFHGRTKSARIPRVG